MMLDNTKSIEEILLDEGVITYKVIGKSMEPMIRQNQDLVTIAKKDPKVSCSENDVVLFKKGGNLVLHRIVDVLPDKLYNILGDNCAKIERNIKDKNKSFLLLMECGVIENYFINMIIMI